MLLRELKVLVQVTISVDQKNSKDFFNETNSGKNQLIFQLKCKQNGKSILLIFHHELIFGIIDKLSGGQAKKNAVPTAAKDLTTWELKLLSKIAEELAQLLEKSLSTQTIFELSEINLLKDKSEVQSKLVTSGFLICHHLVEFAEIRGDLEVVYPDQRQVAHQF